MQDWYRLFNRRGPERVAENDYYCFFLRRPSAASAVDCTNLTCSDLAARFAFMTVQSKKIIRATFVVLTLFAAYEAVKTLLFPEMQVVTSYIVTTTVVGLITIYLAWYIALLQSNLLRSRDENSQRLHETLAKSE